MPLERHVRIAVITCPYGCFSITPVIGLWPTCPVVKPLTVLNGSSGNVMAIPASTSRAVTTYPPAQRDRPHVNVSLNTAVISVVITQFELVLTVGVEARDI